MALDNDAAAARLPISAHPAFGAVVALWFSALLGLGSLVLPPVLLEQLVAGTGIASLVPAANPPLGLTARGLIALAAALAGAALGVAIARRVARTQAPADSSRRPLSVIEELGADKVINGEGLPIDNRRAMAISEDDGPGDGLYRAPPPADDVPEAVEIDGPGEAPLELCDAIEDEPEAALTDPAAADEDDAMTDPFEFADSLDYPGDSGEPLPFAAPSLAHQAPAPEPAWDPEALVPATAQPALEQVPPVEPEGTADWQAAPLERLGLVQLVQRLGATIERRREWLAESTAVTPDAPVAAAPAGFEAAPAEEAVQAMAAWFGSAPAAEPAPAELSADAVEEAGEEGTEPSGDAAYGSLLGMRQANLHAERGQEPVDPDAALRAALATLQKMSGTV